MSNTQRIAVYGLGNMGYLVAQRIAQAFPVSVFDLDQTQLARAQSEFDAQPIRNADDLRDVRIVVLSLPSPAISQAVMRELAPVLHEDSIFIETSTVNPEDMHAAEKLLKPHGIGVIDASVMAGVSQMAAGTASLLIGGAQAHVEACKPVLDAIAQKQVYFGATGAGAAAKVINNAVAHAVMVVVAEAGAMATATGVSHEKLIALLADPQMGLHRPLTHRYAERIVNDNYAGGMPLDAARKDSVLALELAQTAGVPIFAIQASHTVYELAAAAGHGRDDYAAIAKLWEQWGRPTVPRAADK